MVCSVADVTHARHCGRMGVFGYGQATTILSVTPAHSGWDIEIETGSPGQARVVTCTENPPAVGERYVVGWSRHGLPGQGLPILMVRDTKEARQSFAPLRIHEALSEDARTASHSCAAPGV